MMQYFEFSEENVSCFLEITLEDKIVKTRSGQKGTNGVTTVKEFQDVNTAVQEYDKLIQEKKEDESFYFRLGDSYTL
jgi:predicted DNA-binding WGR domain protein